MARATREPQETRKAQDAGKRPRWVTGRDTGGRGGAKRERPVLGARYGPWMDEDPEGPRHRVAGGPVGCKHGMRDGMGPHNSPGGEGNHGTLGMGR